VRALRKMSETKLPSVCVSGSSLYNPKKCSQVVSRTHQGVLLGYGDDPTTKALVTEMMYNQQLFSSWKVAFIDLSRLRNASEKDTMVSEIYKQYMNKFRMHSFSNGQIMLSMMEPPGRTIPVLIWKQEGKTQSQSAAFGRGVSEIHAMIQAMIRTTPIGRPNNEEDIKRLIQSYPYILFGYPNCIFLQRAAKALKNAGYGNFIVVPMNDVDSTLKNYVAITLAKRHQWSSPIVYIRNKARKEWYGDSTETIESIANHQLSSFLR
jgi:hypothetical protein